MLRKRVIPTLLIRGNKLIKGVKFKNHSYVGDPINIVKIFNEKYVDELLIFDIDFSILKQDLNYKLLKEISGECNMPLTYGGGINNVDQVRKLFAIGIEKISINSSAIQNYKLIKSLSSTFGSQSVMVTVDLKKNIFGNYYVFDWRKNKLLKKLNYQDHIKFCVKNGAGEILINIVDNEGTLKGLNLNELNFLKGDYKLPIIVSGGINSTENINNLLKSDLVDAVGVGANFIFHGPHKGVVISYYRTS